VQCAHRAHHEHLGAAWDLWIRIGGEDSGVVSGLKLAGMGMGIAGGGQRACQQHCDNDDVDFVNNQTLNPKDAAAAADDVVSRRQ